MKNKQLIEIKNIFKLILSNDRFSNIFKKYNFSDRLVELLYISKFLVYKYNEEKFDYLQYLLAFNIMFNIRLNIPELIDIDEQWFDEVIKNNKEYFEKMFEEDNCKNNHVKLQFSHFFTKWSFPLNQPLTFFIEKFYGVFNILSDININKEVMNKIKEDLKYNNYNFYKKKPWSYFIIKLLYIITALAAILVSLYPSIQYVILRSDNISIVHVLIFLFITFLLIRFSISLLNIIKYKNYRFYIPINYLPYKSDFPPQLIAEKWDGAFFTIYTVMLVLFFSLDISINNNRDFWFILTSSIAFALIVLHISLLIYIDVKVTKVDSNLLIELYNKYYDEFSELKNKEELRNYEEDYV